MFSKLVTVEPLDKEAQIYPAPVYLAMCAITRLIGRVMRRPYRDLLPLGDELLAQRLDKCTAEIPHKARIVVGQNTNMHPLILTHAGRIRERYSTKG